MDIGDRWIRRSLERVTRSSQERPLWTDDGKANGDKDSPAGPLRRSIVWWSAAATAIFISPQSLI